MNIINLCDHEINVYNSHHTLVQTFSPADVPLRLGELKTEQIKINDLTINVKTHEKDNITMPPVKLGTIYIVSAAVKKMYPYRRDFMSPCDMVFDNNNEVIGCKTFTI